MLDFRQFDERRAWFPDIRTLVPGAQYARGYMGEQRKNGVGQLSESRNVVTANGTPYWQLAQVRDVSIYTKFGGSPAAPAPPSAIQNWKDATYAGVPTQGAGTGSLPLVTLGQRR